MRPSLQWLLAQMPAGQLRRFIAIGLWNTVFGYACFALLTVLLGRVFTEYGYILAGFIAGVVNITVSFFGYKLFVFKTRGNFIGEWLRCMIVASSGIALGFVLLPVLVYLIRRFTGFDHAAPYAAGAAIAFGNAILNFLGHRNFTFRSHVRG